MKKTIHLLLIPLLLAGSGWGITQAAVVKIQPGQATFLAPDHQTVEVVAVDVQDLLGASLVIRFDPSVVTPVAAAPGEGINGAPCSLFYQWVNQGDLVDTIELDMGLLGCTEDVNGALAVIEFAGVASGTTDLIIEGLELRDSANDPIPAEVINGSLTYLEEVQGTLSFQPEGVLFDEEGTCEICLHLEDVEDFLGMSVEFSFDPAVVEPLAVYGGEALNEAGCPNYLAWVNQGSVVNTMEIDVALLGCHGPMEGDVVCLTFQGVALGTSPLEFLEVQVRDGENNPVLVNLVAGEISFDPAIAVDAVEFGSLKSRFR